MLQRMFLGIVQAPCSLLVVEVPWHTMHYESEHSSVFEDLLHPCFYAAGPLLKGFYTQLLQYVSCVKEEFWSVVCTEKEASKKNFGT